MNYHIITDIPESLHHQILVMIHQSFEERLSAGMHFTCSSYTMDDLKEKVLSGVCFLAVTEGNDVLGIISFTKYQRGASYLNIAALSPDAKGLDIGSKLFSLCQERMILDGVKYILSDTAVGAKSSVKWHLDKCGFSKVGMKSFLSTNYYSYVFRKDLVKQPFYVKHVKYPLLFFISSVKTVMCQKANGELTGVGNCLSKLKHWLEER